MENVTLLLVFEAALAVLVASLTGIYVIRLNRRRGFIMMSDIALIFAVCFFCGGSILGVFVDFFLFDGDPPWPYRLELGAGKIALGFLSLGLYLLGLRFSKIPFRSARNRLNLFIGLKESQVSVFGRHVLKTPLTCFWVAFALVWALRMVRFATGGGITGTNTFESALAVPYPIVVAMFLFFPLKIFIICYSVARSFIYKHWWFLSFVAIEFVFAFSQGRREALFVLVYAVVFYATAGRKIPLVPLVAGGAVGLLVLYAASPLFLAVRSEVQQQKARHEGKAIDSLVMVLGDRMESEGGREFEMANERWKANQNLSLRTRLYLMWTSQLAVASMDRTPMLGQSIFHGVMNALPRAVRPYRYWGDHAAVIQNHYGFRIGDISDNHAAAGLADFSLVGPLVYGFLFGLLVNGIGFLALRRFFREPFFAGILFCYLWEMSTSFEYSVTHVFMSIRNIVIVLALLYGLRLMNIRFGSAKFTAHNHAQIDYSR